MLSVLIYRFCFFGARVDDVDYGVPRGLLPRLLQWRLQWFENKCHDRPTGGGRVEVREGEKMGDRVYSIVYERVR